MIDIRKIGYAKYLKQKREAAQALREAEPKQPTLSERIEKWYEGLPDEDKRRAFTMKEFRALFGETPQRISAVLWDQNWTRKRSTRNDLPTSRYWLKNK